MAHYWPDWLVKEGKEGRKEEKGGWKKIKYASLLGCSRLVHLNAVNTAESNLSKEI